LSRSSYPIDRSDPWSAKCNSIALQGEEQLLARVFDVAIGAEPAMATATSMLLKLIQAPAQLERPLAAFHVLHGRAAIRIHLRLAIPILSWPIPKAPMRPWLLPLLLAACGAPVPPEPSASRDPPAAAVCRGEDGQVLRQDPRIGAQTGLPTPRSIYTRGAATFRAGPKRDEAELFMLVNPSAVVILRECGFYRLARVPDGRSGWLRASALTTRPPAQERRATR
jgi:hypothetical protein